MERLSNELLEQSFSYLDCSDIEACRLTCRRFLEVVKGSVLLHYLCRLQLAARIDPELSSSKLSVSQRLAALNDLEDAWLRAQFTYLSTVKLPLTRITYSSSMNGVLYFLTGSIWISEEIMRLPDFSTDNPVLEGRRLRLGNRDTNRGRRVVKEVGIGL